MATRYENRSVSWALGSLKCRGIALPEASRRAEVLLERAGRLRFFGVAAVCATTVTLAAQVLEQERCSYLVALPAHVPVDELLQLGWLGGLRDDSELLNHIGRLAGLVVSKAGAFDDPMRGLIGIARPDILHALVS